MGPLHGWLTCGDGGRGEGDEQRDETECGDGGANGAAPAGAQRDRWQ
jgi:hypothetical protein